MRRFVVSDWEDTHSTVDAINAGLDIQVNGRCYCVFSIGGCMFSVIIVVSELRFRI